MNDKLNSLTWPTGGMIMTASTYATQVTENCTFSVMLKTNVLFVMGRSRVAPPKQLTVPSLELSAALTGAQLSKLIIYELTDTDGGCTVRCWMIGSAPASSKITFQTYTKEMVKRHSGPKGRKNSTDNGPTTT